MIPLSIFARAVKELPKPDFYICLEVEPNINPKLLQLMVPVNRSEKLDRCEINNDNNSPLIMIDSLSNIPRGKQ